MPNGAPPAYRLLYDLRWMEPGQAGGIEQANYELISEIARRDGRNRYLVFAPRNACREWAFPASFHGTCVPSDSDAPEAERFHAFVGRLKSGTTPGDCPDLAFDLVHSTSSFIHPELLDFPGVLTIQDLQHLRHPEFFSPADREDRDRLYGASLARARHVICGSEFTRRDVHERYRVPLDKLTTIWNIPTSSVWEELPQQERRGLTGAMGIEGPFFLYPAHPWPHKNHDRLLQAWQAAAGALPREVQLVMTGPPLPSGHPAVARLAQAPRALHIGYRSRLEMRALFQECMALVFPSLYEGFGMPVAEAIIAGRPVACSNVTSLPEVAGDAAITFDPNDVGQIAARMVDLATRPELRQALSAAALARRTVFSAAASAEKTLHVYARVHRELAASG